MVQLVQSGKLTGFTPDKEGVWRFQKRVCVPKESDLRKMILEEAHRSEFTIHHDINKMYQDLKKMFWWPGMKVDAARLVNKCLV